MMAVMLTTALFLASGCRFALEDDLEEPAQATAAEGASEVDDPGTSLDLGCGHPKTAGPGQGERCPNGTCGAGLTCIAYYGIAGPQGPKFTSCEIPCHHGGACGAGQRCVIIADGPGQVCRP